ncbi:MAG: phenylalanine--tRNA ligase subunit alpha [Acidimicrobiia bacterium]|nr:phenylalanine--tRNA ligase subunit alpha [Acidimicrobiia bacterium]MYC45453.1 phenylalanine--tRNA ligase subunit alpha [Acidimicrobiia bacterium]MYI19186.1 phenylalanine--tRNA ligase subunit alpha [Acidimicrobiia bacterium]
MTSDAPAAALAAEARALAAEAVAALEAAGSVAELTAARPDLFGRGSPLTGLRRRLGELAPEDRPVAGRALSEALAEVESRYEARLEELRAGERRRRLEAERLDLTELPEPPQVGRLHVITQTLQRLEDVFCAMGYTVAEGPEIETEWHNFGALNFPPGHPARDMYDTLYVDHGPPGSTLLRTHTSPVQVRVMENQPPPLYVVAPGRCYRQDTADATHMPVFHQIEGLVVDDGITLGDLAGAIETFTTAYFGPGFTSRLRPSYFPFTEPSAEFDVQRPDGTWLELGGCGVVHPSVLEVCGVDPERWSGFAFGFGIDRLAMLRYGIGDLRDLWTNDVRFLEQF